MFTRHVAVAGHRLGALAFVALLTWTCVTSFALAAPSESAAARVLEVTKGNFEATLRRSGFAVVLYTVTPCQQCDVDRTILREAAEMVATRHVGAVFATINVSDVANHPAGTECDPGALGLNTFPDWKVAHFGRVNHKIARVPRSTAEELADFVETMARPASVEVKSAEAVLDAIRNAQSKYPLVVGYLGEAESQYRLSELAESFRGMAHFAHVPIDRVADVLQQMNEPEIRETYAVLTRGAAVPRMSSFVIYKQQERDGTDLFGTRMKKALATLKERSKPRRVTGFDPMRADGGAGMEVSKKGTRSAAARPTASELRNGSFTAWSYQPTIDLLDAFADITTPEEQATAPSLLHGRHFDRDRMNQFLARHLIPPVDVLTVHNREQFNVRTPYIVFIFTPTVSQRAVDERRRETNAKMHGIHEERQFMLTSVSELRYMSGRCEALSDEFPAYTFVFAALDENRQVFNQFGFDLDAYDRNDKNLVAAIHGDRKFVFHGSPDAFRVADVRTWLRDVDAGHATSFIKSSPAPPTVPDAGEGDLAVVVHDTFEQYVVDRRDRDVIIVFSHEDDLSERILSRFQDLAAAEEGNTDLFVAAFDALNNDPPARFGYESLPTIFFVKKGGAAADVRPLEYDGDFTLSSIADFLQGHASVPPRNSFSGMATDDNAPADATKDTAYYPKPKATSTDAGGEGGNPTNAKYVRDPDSDRPKYILQKDESKSKPDSATGVNKFVRSEQPHDDL